MGFSLEVSIPLDAEGPIGDVLVPAFGGGFFQPVAVGALEGHSIGGDHWFLAGYALEHFLTLVLTRKVRRPASLSLFTTQDVELNAYQQLCADTVKGAIPGRRPRSPFEWVDERLGVTALEPKHLTEEALVALTRWADRFPKATLRVYGAIPLALQKPAESTWLRAFQEAEPAEESQLASLAPFLTLHLYTADPFVGRRLVIRTQSYVWLREGRALGGRVTPEDADTNLRDLASFARTLAHGKRAQHRAAELSLDGGLYAREEARLRAAFQDLL